MEGPLAMFTADITKLIRKNDSPFYYTIWLKCRQADGFNSVVACTWGKRYNVIPMAGKSQLCIYDSNDTLVAVYFVQSIEEKEYTYDTVDDPRGCDAAPAQC
jgi:hypothetical protein